MHFFPIVELWMSIDNHLILTVKVAMNLALVPSALTTLSSIGLLHAPQMGIPALSWHLKHINSPFFSRASAASSHEQEAQLKW